MYSNYYFLNRLVIEFFKVIIEGNILSAFSQEKDRLIIEFYKDEKYFIEFSTNQSFPYIQLRSKYTRSKKNTLDFFPSLNNSKILNIQIAKGDRVIKIVTSSGDLFFMIRGIKTNVFYYNSNGKSSFNKTEKDELNDLFNELNLLEFTNSFNYPDDELIRNKSVDQLRKHLPGLNKDIILEVKQNAKDPSDEPNCLVDVLKKINNNKPALYFDELNKNIIICFDGFTIYKGYEKEIFDDLFSAFNVFKSQKYFYEREFLIRKSITVFLEKELLKTTNKLNNLKIVIDQDSKEKELKTIAELILINLDKIKPGSNSIKLKNIYDNEFPIVVKLDPKLQPYQNAQTYFDKARSSSLNYSKSKELFLTTSKYFDKLKLIKEKLEISKSIEELESIMKELKLDQIKADDTEFNLADKFKHYLIENKYDVYVGKDSTNNDLLTTKFAKQNDLWFHARAVSGSHVVLRIQNTKEVVPKSVIKNAASLAAYHSKAKTAGLVPVSYTFKKYVVKRKGSPAGQVNLLKEEVVIVKPEIPSNCVFLKDDNI